MEQLLKTKKDRAQFNKWLTALYEEKYTKGEGALQSGQGFCCLGVGCMELIPEGKKHVLFDRLDGVYAGDQSEAPKWLKHVNWAFEQATGTSLSQLNDGDSIIKLTHPEIAMCLDLVYNHKALD